MSEAGVELVIVSGAGAVPVRRVISKMVTTIGADPSADVRLTTVARHWAVVKRRGEVLEIREMATGSTHELALGGTLTIDGVSLQRPVAEESVAPLPVDRLAAALTDVDVPRDALRALLRTLLDEMDADGGAFVLREGKSYTVPLAERRDGSPLEQSEELLSDTLIRDVLERGEPVCVSDAMTHTRYGQVPSVAALQLSSVLCVPMVLGGQTMGALFLGKRGARASFEEAHIADLRTVASMVLPLLAQLRRSAARGGDSQYLLVGEDAAMEEVRRLVGRVGPSNLSVLILGDTGTGKEMVARALHHASPRANRDMIALNCSAVPESLLGGELFGAKKGAYTGAVADRKGVVERADGSTLFLDEVGDMPAPMQAALLRVLEERAVTRLGDSEVRKVDFRLVAATHKDLAAEVEAGRFRRDLLFRLQEMTLVLPSLAQRGEDVLLLANLFLRQAEKELGLWPHRLSPAAERALLKHPWPGNVRELKATMRRAALLCDSDVIAPGDLHLTSSRSAAPAADELDLPLAEARERFVVEYAERVLEKHDGNREAAAAALGISLRTLYRYLG
ncbi:MAG: sigma 54-interacting transcriptional regulator [Myxococcota bacterium]